MLIQTRMPFIFFVVYFVPTLALSIDKANVYDEVVFV